MDTRVAELLELAESEGITLPYSPEKIIEFEDQGHVVDLQNGQIILHGADLYVDSTVIGEATAVVLEAEGV